MTHHWIENYLERYFLIGCCKDAAHRSWILGRGKYKRTDMYNVRLGTRAGSVASTATLTRSPRFLVLYDVSDATKYSVYRIKSGGKCDKAKMLKLGYTTAQHDYYCYVLEEEVSLGDLDLSRLLADRRREQEASFTLGAPIYLKGVELTSRTEKWMRKRFAANKKIRARADRAAAKGRCRRNPGKAKKSPSFTLR